MEAGSSSASVKVPGGKLVEVEARFDSRVREVDVTGDFFLEPPEALEEIEETVEGTPVDFDDEELIEKLQEIDAEPIGFSFEDLVEALKEAVK